MTKNKGAFVSDDALMKILYLSAIQISDRWVVPIKNWRNILKRADNLLQRPNKNTGKLSIKKTQAFLCLSIEKQCFIFPLTKIIVTENSTIIL